MTNTVTAAAVANAFRVVPQFRRFSVAAWDNYFANSGLVPVKRGRQRLYRASEVARLLRGANGQHA